MKNNLNQFKCGCCNETLSKDLAVFLDHDSFKYLEPKPQFLSNPVYCNPCYNTHVEPLLESYNENLAKAEEILIFTKTQTKETRFVKRLEKPLKIESGLDEQDVFMKLAYLAAAKGFNALVDVDVKATKVRDGSYQTMSYSGSGIPANVSDKKLLKDRSLWSNPN